MDRQSSYQRTIIVFRRSRINKHWRVSRRSEESKAHFNTVSFLDDLPGVWSGTGNRNTFFLEQSAGLDFRIADNVKGETLKVPTCMGLSGGEE